MAPRLPPRSVPPTARYVGHGVYNWRVSFKDAMNFFQQGIPLGRWFKISVVLHWTFIAYAAWTIFGAPAAQQKETAIFMGLLFATVLLHEFGHALACQAVGGRADHIVLWPLGGIAFVQPPNNVKAWFITTLCGPLVNAVLWPVFYFLARYLVIRDAGPDAWDQLLLFMRENPFTMVPGLPTLIQICLSMWQINKLLLLFNLIPAYPMDGGRLLQELLWASVGHVRSLQISGMVGTVVGGCFVVLGLGLQQISIPSLGFSLGGKNPDYILIIIGALCITQSFGIYRQSQQVRGWRRN
jgi:Zn-dependent protease